MKLLTSKQVVNVSDTLSQLCLMNYFVCNYSVHCGHLVSHKTKQNKDHLGSALENVHKLI